MAGRAETYELILNKAEELFCRFGPMRTTVAEIARALRMSPANVYKFFPTKHAIIEAVGARFMTAIRHDLVPLMAADKPAWDRIEAVMRSVNRHFSDMIESNLSQHGAEFFANVLEFELLKREHKWQFVGEFLHSTLSADLALLLREGVEKDGLRVTDPDETAQTMIDCLSSSIEPVMMIGKSRLEIEARLERQLRLLARCVM